MGARLGKGYSHIKTRDKKQGENTTNFDNAAMDKKVTECSSLTENSVSSGGQEIKQNSQAKTENSFPLTTADDSAACLKRNLGEDNSVLTSKVNNMHKNDDLVMRTQTEHFKISSRSDGKNSQESSKAKAKKKAAQMNSRKDILCTDAEQVDMNLANILSKTGAKLADIDVDMIIENDKNVDKVENHTVSLSVEGTPNNISMKGGHSEVIEFDQINSERNFIDTEQMESGCHTVDVSSMTPDKYQGDNTVEMDVVMNHEGKSVVNNRIISNKKQKTESSSEDTDSGEKKVDVYILKTLESLLIMMDARNSDWSNTITEVLKHVRTSIKVQEKAVTAVLVKCRVADKFLTFLELEKIDLVAKLSNEDIDSLICWPSYKRFLTLFWILCDGSVNFCQYILATKVFEYLVMELRVISTKSHSLHSKSLYLLKAILGIFHNICRHVLSSKWVFRNEGLVSVLRIFLNCDIPMVRVKTLMILSYITSETENEIINSDDENFQFIFVVLTDAVNSENHMSLKYGMNAAEVLKGLCNLAVNDENKIRIVKNRGLPLYERILETGTKEEKKLAVTTLWSLAFHHYNKQKMRDMRGIMQKLHALEFPESCSDDDEICHAARGTIWELENITTASVDRNYSSSTERDSNIPHIMVSYQWDSQPIMVKVKDRLRQAGYKVWMDVEHMTGSTLEAMALAVEKAAVVLICMSQKYKDSPNCRTEAEYVYRLHKDFVPLQLQQDYIPDGWLGIMVGTRLYFDVYTEDIIDRQIPGLIRELRDRGKLVPTYDSVEQGMVVPARMTSREAVLLPPSRSPDVSSWSPADVNSWLNTTGCQDIATRLPELDGSLLTELHHIQTKAPEFFYNILKSEFQLSIVEVLKFSKFLRHLIK